AHADRVNACRSRQRTDGDRDVVTAPGAIDDVGEQKRASLVLAQAALKLPAHQRMQLGVLVDGAIDAKEEAFGFEPAQMLLKVERRAARCHSCRVGCALVEHRGTIWLSDALR